MLVGGAEEEPLSWRWGKEDGYMLFEYSSIVGDEEEDPALVISGSEFER